MSKADYYDILGVDRSADDQALKSAFRKKAMQFHPDRNPNDATSETKFKEINEAYATLKDPRKRQMYDQYGHAAFEGGGGAGFGQDFGASMSDIFDDIFGEFMGGRRSRSQHQRGSDLRYNLEISLEEAFSGKTIEIRLPTAVTCETCSGSGAKPGTSPVKCRTCSGIGKVRASQGFFTIERICPSCQGRGEMIEEPCGTCSGSGRTTKERMLSVNIPKGIEDGTRIRLSGEGEAGLNGGPVGDLYIFISIKPHEIFQRDGAELYCRVPISMVTAALGGAFEVPTLDGTRTNVDVPAGTQTDKQFRLRGKGMPILRSTRMGDMYVQTIVEIPRNLNRRQRELLEEFKAETSEDNHPESTGFFDRMRHFFDNLGT